jgi:formylglycine-generating enzyme required for sulfatase activity
LNDNFYLVDMQSNPSGNLLKSVRSTLFVLVIGIMNVHISGCRVSESTQAAVIVTKEQPNIQMHISTVQTSITVLQTQTLTPKPIENRLATPEFSKTVPPSVTPSPTLSPGENQVSPSDEMVIVFIPAGEYLMGSLETDIGADYDELPQHLVYLNSYWIDQTVVTNAMYAHFLNEMGNQIEDRSTWMDAGDDDVLIVQQDGIWKPKEGFENHPAVEVTWFGARAYCQWAGRRLPTEAEWEIAARGALPGGDNDRIYPWGDEISCDKAQYANCGGGLLPVNSKPAGASPTGVLGLSGNTWEWISDWYADDYYAESPLENPKGPSEGVTRVLRGGSWEYDWKHLRSANRRHNGPSVSMHDYGFRCVVDEK